MALRQMREDRCAASLARKDNWGALLILDDLRGQRSMDEWGQAPSLCSAPKSPAPTKSAQQKSRCWRVRADFPYRAARPGENHVTGVTLCRSPETTRQRPDLNQPDFASGLVHPIMCQCGGDHIESRQEMKTGVFPPAKVQRGMAAQPVRLIWLPAR